MTTSTGGARAATRPARRGAAHRRGRLRAEMETRVQVQRRQPLPPWLVGSTARRALALTPAATFALGVLAAVAGGGFTTAVLALVTSLLASSGTVQLRRMTRMLDMAPEHLLDEREVSERETAYRHAFRLTLVLLASLVALTVLNGFLAQETDVQLISSVGWMVLLLASLLSVSMLPAAALAWTWPTSADGVDDLDE